MVKQLLTAGAVNLNLLSEKVDTTKEKEIKIQYGSAGGVTGATGQTGSLGGVKPTQTTTPEETKDEEEEGISEEVRKEIEKRRAELMRQYVNAGIQISEGMNAVSNKFYDRADVLAKFAQGAQTESAAYGLAQDTGRYVLLETLRGLALSSVQMGVQATRLLNEQTVEVVDDES